MSELSVCNSICVMLRQYRHATMDILICSVTLVSHNSARTMPSNIVTIYIMSTDRFIQAVIVSIF